MHAVSNLAIATETKTIFTLPHTLRTVAIARACRTAFVNFCNGAPRWGRRELASWLMGPYSEITRSTVELLGDGPRGVTSRRSVDTVRLSQVLQDGVTSGRDLLRASMYPEGGALNAWDAWRKGFVVRCEDEDANEGWAPLSLPGMRLNERLLSLWAADYLCGSDDYEMSFGMCEVCESASFDPFLRAKSRCAAHVQAHIEVEWPDGQSSVYTSHLSDAPRSSRVQRKAR